MTPERLTIRCFLNFRRNILVVALALAVLPAWASDRKDAMAEFAVNRARWNAADIHDYEFRLRDETCWCQFGPAYGPIRNVVRSGLIQQAIYEGERRDGYWRGRRVQVDVQTKATIEDVFARAALAIEMAPEGALRVAYDSTYGFPVLIDFDDPAWEDEQWRLVADGFRLLSAGAKPAPDKSQEGTRER